MTTEKQAAIAAIEEKADLVAQVADQIWSFAELSLQEEQSAALYCRVLEQEGFIQRRQGSGTYVRRVERRRERSWNVGVMATYISEYIFPSILRGIEGELSEEGFFPLLSATKNRVDNERRILEDYMEKRVDGLIVEGTKSALPNPNLHLYEKLKEMGIPVVFFNSYYPALQGCVSVTMDDRQGGIDAVEYGMDIFRTRGGEDKMPIAKLVEADSKEFKVNDDVTVLIAQRETVDLPTVMAREAEIRDHMKKLVEDNGYEFALLLVTDILAEGSQFIVEGDPARVNRVFEIECCEGGNWMPGVLSRKKQVAAPILAS